MSFNKGLFLSQTPEWETPHDLYKKLDLIHNFDLDPACTTKNCKCPNGFYRDKGMDGLKERWYGNVYLNPPYGREIKKWVEKAYHEHRLDHCKEVVALLPARTDTRWFWDYIYQKPLSVDIKFIRGRLKFGGSKNSAPFPSMIVIWKKCPEPKD